MSLPVAVICEDTVFVLVHVDQFLTAHTSAIEAPVLRCIPIPGKVFHEAKDAIRWLHLYSLPPVWLRYVDIVSTEGLLVMLFVSEKEEKEES